MSNEIKTTEQPETQSNVINYAPVFPVLTASILLDLPVEDMVNGILNRAVDIKNYPGGYTTYVNNESIDNIKGVAELKETIYGVCCSFAKELKYDLNFERVKMQVWANVMRGGNYHEAHDHSGALFSGTFYAKIDDTMSPIVFKNPNHMYRGHEPRNSPKDQTPFTAPYLTIQPTVNQLYVWPAWLEHAVPEMQVGGPRVSFSFNVDFLPPGV